MVPLANDDDGHLGLVALSVGGRVHLLARAAERRELAFQNEAVLSLGDAVPVDEDVPRQHLVALLPLTEAGLERFVQRLDHPF